MTDKRNPFSFEGKLALIVGCMTVAVSGLGVGAQVLTGNPWLSLLLAVSAGLPIALWLMHCYMMPVNKLFQALISGIASLRDNDFSTSIAETRRDELGNLVAAYNELGSILRDERQSILQRELLLDTVIQSTPLALVLTNSKGAIVYSNAAARNMFMGGRRLEGRDFRDMLKNVPSPIGDAIAHGRDGLFTVESGVEHETYHLSQREFVLNVQPHHLYLFKRLTSEIKRQEVATWKNVIRVIGHELNNSLAPISSLAHSGSLVVGQPDREQFSVIFSTIEERANHLKDFIDGYSRFAKLPRPQPEDVDWAKFIKVLQETVPFEYDGEPPSAPGYFDPVQIEQVLINLLKNANESGSRQSSIVVGIAQDNKRQTIRVLDRGSGMSEKVLNNALLPFYSTKRNGSGLGLPLCREIVEAHGGTLSFANRRQGGLLVELSIPAQVEIRCEE